MKIKTGRRQSLKEFAKEKDIDYLLVKQYQKLRSRFADATLKFQKKYGGERSGERLRDIRDINFKNIPYNQRQLYMGYLVESAEEKVRHSFDYLRQRQDTFLTNILDVLESSEQYANMVETEALRQFLTSDETTTTEKANLIGTLTGRGVSIFKYNEDDELIFGASHVMQAVRENIMDANGEYEKSPDLNVVSSIVNTSGRRRRVVYR